MVDPDVAFWLVHSVSAQSEVGRNSNGPVLSPAVNIDCLVQDVLRVVLNSEGESVTSTTTIAVALEDVPTFGPGVIVTLPSGRLATVISAASGDSGSLGLGLDHGEIYLT